MLTVSQCEVVAYVLNESGEYTCPACTREALNRIEFAKLESGLGEYIGHGIIRYELDELNGELAYEGAEEEYERENESGTYDREESPRPKWQIIDEIADTLSDSYDERCASCGGVL